MKMSDTIFILLITKTLLQAIYAIFSVYLHFIIEMQIYFSRSNYLGLLLILNSIVM